MKPFASRVRRSHSLRDVMVRSERNGVENRRTVHREQIQEKWMKLVKTSAIACALSALIATPVLAQGTSSGVKSGGTVQSKPMQGGATMGSEDDDVGAQQGSAGEKVGMKSGRGTKGNAATTGSATHKGTADDSAATGKRY
ncbi:hypothetical protein [Bradyrhizobium frederickii]|uniref:hypothetical protein n=1 Tax=Bradyrhizobium frederickii TaxID=2560054 RepID=UPI001F29027B|nr:hypothetical protein [Bradyrhizobium frederickii]